jgi:hypothetical protein
MIINKATSDNALVGSLVLLAADGSYITSVTEFDTTTWEATLSPSGSATVDKFWFAPSDTITPQDIGEAIEAEEENSFLHLEIRRGQKFAGKRAMDDTDTSPSDSHRVLGEVKPYLVQCSNCATLFIVYIAQDDKVYETKRANASDKHLTATEIADPENYTCDSCANAVALLR